MNLQQFSDKIAIFDFQFRKDLQTTIPKIIANKAVFLFKKNFQDESFFGARWKEVNRRIPHEQSYFTKSGKKCTRVAPAKGAEGKKPTHTGGLAANKRRAQSYGDPLPPPLPASPHSRVAQWSIQPAR